MTPNVPPHLHLVCVGGGHAQIAVLKSFGMRPIPGLQITLISDVDLAPYSGMLPGYVEGVWSHDDMHIDLAKLAAFAGANFIRDEVTAINPETNQVLFAHRPPISFDILSLNSGAVPDLSLLKGAGEHAIAVKPIAHFLKQLPASEEAPAKVSVIGAGIAGIELSLALKKRFQDTEISLFSRSDELLPHMSNKARILCEDALQNASITLHKSCEITEFSDKYITSQNGQEFASDQHYLVTGVRPAPFITSLGKGRDETGFVAVRNTLQNVIYPHIFAAGDVAHIVEYPREKAGVFAVRAGVILAYNIRQLIRQRPLKQWRPQKQYLALIGTADGKAIAIRNGIASHKALWWRLKAKIDTDFMKKFSDLPQMTQEDFTPLPFYQTRYQDQNDAAFRAMKCAGCAAKASAHLLEKVLEDAKTEAERLGADPRYFPSSEGMADSGMTAPLARPLLHSFDALSKMVSDPFLFAKIATNHALSDLYVSGASPRFAQLHLTVREASQSQQYEEAFQLMTGLLCALSEAQTTLVGGHTSQATEIGLGLAVSGEQTASFAAFDPHTSYSLVMSKHLGIGVGLAAAMRHLCPASLYRTICDDMALSNQQAAADCLAHGAIAMTDITGFGLARHATNLAFQLQKQTAQEIAFEISLSQLPVFPGIDTLLAGDISSSSMGNNQRSVPTLGATPSAARDWRYPLLFDPQTAGGICAVLPTAQTSALQKISPSLAIIGQVRLGATGILIES